MLDLIVKGGTVVRGTLEPPETADVAIRDGVIVGVGRSDEPARRVIDADGLVVTPGFVDPHTHYDAQLHWDGAATPSSLHGVTSVIAGNCGFTLAPLRAADAGYTRQMMARVEGMSLEALEAGVPWSWESFDDFLASLDGRIGVNAGFMVGHCALRRYVMGEAALEREATPEELEQLMAVLRASLRAGGLGLSTSRSSSHSDGDGRAVASRVASEQELLALCAVVGELPGTSLEAIVEGCLQGFSDAEVELLAGMSVRAGRRLNWNVLNVKAPEREGRIERQLRPSARARELGGRVVALTMPVQAEMNMSFATFCALWLIPGWKDVLGLPPGEKTARLRDPAVRAELVAAAAGTPFARFARFDEYSIGDTVAPQNAAFANRDLGGLARERNLDPFELLVEILVADDYRTVLWPYPEADSDADWSRRLALWRHPDVVLGGSDAGAHLDRILGSPYPTRFLADTLRGRRLVPLEEAVHLLTAAPARLFGLRGRGELREGFAADVVVVDPDRVGSGPAHRAHDLPAEAMRMTAASEGVSRVLVNGAEVVVDGEPTGARAGRVLRSGGDTYTAPLGDG